MVKCKGCPAEVYFDQKLHVKLLKEKGLNPDDVMKEGSKLRDDGLGSGRPFDFGSDPPKVHACPSYDPVGGKWGGRANTTKNVYHGYVYNAHNIKKTSKTDEVKPVIISPKPITSSTVDKEVIVFSEQSILETQKRIIRDIEVLSNRIENMNKTIVLIQYLLMDKTPPTDVRRT